VGLEGVRETLSSSGALRYEIKITNKNVVEGAEGKATRGNPRYICLYFFLKKNKMKRSVFHLVDGRKEEEEKKELSRCYFLLLTIQFNFFQRGSCNYPVISCESLRIWTSWKKKEQHNRAKKQLVEYIIFFYLNPLTRHRQWIMDRNLERENGKIKKIIRRVCFSFCVTVRGKIYFYYYYFFISRLKRTVVLFIY